MPERRYCIPDPSAALVDRLIMHEIEPGSRVLDLGCGDGRLLCRLRDEHRADVLGIELDHSLMLATVSKGIAVLKADLDEGLSEIPDHAFDYAVLSHTLQQVRHPRELLVQMLRVARRILVVVPNYGHWRVRLQILLHGRAPITSSLPYDWYNSPNIHFLSMIDFRELVTRMGVRIVREVPIVGGKPVQRVFAANLRAENALFVLEEDSLAHELVHPHAGPRPERLATADRAG